MKKLIKGIINFRKTKQLDYCTKFSDLSLSQSPDALLIACSDSRVVPNLFASTDPGDLFVLRNIGNLILPYLQNNLSEESAVTSALEFSLNVLNVSDIIICGHSGCGAMNALLDQACNNHLKSCNKWLAYATPSYERFKKEKQQSCLCTSDQLSQINVLQQLDHLKTYPLVVKHMAENKLRIHGWWFDLATADVFYYNQDKEKFVVIDDKESKYLLDQVK